jgi:hypothetical protein
MLLTPSSLYCWILDEVDDHFLSIWELLSVFRQRLPTATEVDLQQQLQHALLALQQSRYVQFFEGVLFNGDEHLILPAITAEFIAVQAEGWKEKDWSVKQLKLYITDSGRAFFLTCCSATFFDGIG